MQVHAIMYICPECRKLITFVPTSDGTINVNALLCTEDGYTMKPVLINSLMIDALLKHGVPDAPSEATGA